MTTNHTLDTIIALAVGYGARPASPSEEPSGAAHIGDQTVGYVSDPRFTHSVAYDRTSIAYRLALGGVFVGHAVTEQEGHRILRAVTEATLRAMDAEGLTWEAALEDAAIDAAEAGDEWRNADYRKAS